GFSRDWSSDVCSSDLNQEDHVSMATHGARRLSDMVDNTAHIAAIELLAAAQGIDLRRPLATSPRLQRAQAAIRERAAFLDNDRIDRKSVVEGKSMDLG